MSGFYTTYFHSDRTSVCSTMEMDLLGEALAGRCPLVGTVCQEQQSDNLLLSTTTSSADLASGLVGLGRH